jgi:REP element-mobilizing transposase RayT
VILDGGQRKKFTIIAFSILPDHVYLLVQKEQPAYSSRFTVVAMKQNKKPSAGAVTSAGDSYSDLMYYIKSFVFHRLRKECGFTFSPWQPRFNFRIIDSERRYENTFNYIRNNYKKHRLPFMYGHHPYIYNQQTSKTPRIIQFD